jgi:hypothetical protein
MGMMTPQNWMRRAALIEQAITDTALDYRFGDTYARRGKKEKEILVVEPRTTKDLKEGWEHAIELWNSNADLIDRKSSKRIVGARVVRTGAMSARFEPADVPRLWTVLGTLDRLDAHKASKDPDLEPGIVRWMADFLFISLIPQELIVRAAHTKGHIFDRRLRHTKRAKARRHQAFIAEASLVLEDARQQAEFQEGLRSAIRKDSKIRRDVRQDRNLADFDFSTAPPNVKIVQLGDHKGFMLTPAGHGRAKRSPKYPETK